MSALDKAAAFPSLLKALGPPPKYGWFPGYPLCAECGDKPCVCCPECGEVFYPWLCGHGAPTPEVLTYDFDVIPAGGA